MPLTALPLVLAAVVAPSAACAAELDGRTLGLAWALPFAGILLSIALGPLRLPAFWQHHYGKIAAGWALAAARCRCARPSA